MGQFPGGYVFFLFLDVESLKVTLTVDFFRKKLMARSTTTGTSIAGFLVDGVLSCEVLVPL